MIRDAPALVIIDILSCGGSAHLGHELYRRELMFTRLVLRIGSMNAFGLVLRD